jgi:hypothetical protein
VPCPYFSELVLEKATHREKPGWEHLKEAKKTVVGWRSLCGASNVSLRAGSNRERDAPLHCQFTFRRCTQPGFSVKIDRYQVTTSR